MIEKGNKVTVKPGCYHMMSATDLAWKEGEIARVPCDGTNRVEVTFPPGTLRGSRGAPTFHMHKDNLIPSKLVAAYKSGVAKLNKEERKALRV